MSRPTDEAEPAAVTSLALNITNSRTTPLALDLEPWGEHYEVPAGASFLATAHGPAGGTLDIEQTEIGITLWGWPGSIVSLSCDGLPLGSGASARLAAPDLPAVPGGDLPIDGE